MPIVTRDSRAVGGLTASAGHPFGSGTVARRGLLAPCRSRESVGQRMQDIERVTQIQALAQPGRARRPRVHAEPLRVVLRAERLTASAGTAAGAGTSGSSLPSGRRNCSAPSGCRST